MMGWEPPGGSGVAVLASSLGGVVVGTILVVEDETSVRLAVVALLADAGYRVLQADGGARALEMVGEQAPSVVLIDLMMPEVSGWDVIQALKADPRLQRVPVVLMSGVGSALAPQEGVARILQKPVTGEKLLATLREVCAE